MKLHVTLTSPYARIVRAALIEHGLENAIEVVPARTRETNSPYYAVTPSGRVPFLEIGTGRVLEETDVLVAYFDEIGHGPPLTRPLNLNNWQYGRLQALAKSYIDGIAVWGRELRRPADERSPSIIAHEQQRHQRLVDAWSREITHPLMTGPLNLAQLTLYCSFDAMEHYTPEQATPNHPDLQDWRARLSERPSLAATRPPPKR